MESFKTKLGELLNATLKAVKAAKRRISEEYEAFSEQNPKQQKTGFTHAAAVPLATPSHANSDVYTFSSQNLSGNPLPPRAHAMDNKSPVASTPGSTSLNPIDLTDVMSVDVPSPYYTAKDLQILEDERLARALQDELDSRPAKSGPDPLSDFATFDATQANSSSELLSEYGNRLQSTTCGKCAFEMGVDGPYITSRTKGLVLSPEGLHPYIRCTRCRLYCCIGCGTYHRDLNSLLSGSKNHTSTIDLSRVAYCCNEGRQFLIFSLLCGPEFTQLQPADQPAAPLSPSITGRIRTRLRSKSDQPSYQTSPTKSPKPTQSPTKPSQSRPSDSQLSKGTGYGGDASLIPSRLLGGPQYKPKKGLKLEISDELLERYLRLLAVLFPRLHRHDRTNFDINRHQLIGAMIPRSPLMQAVLELLRDESMEDITAKYQLYNALVDLLDTIHGHPDTKVTLFHDQALYPTSQQLVHVAFSSPRPVNTPGETTQSLNSALRKLAGYCQFYLSKAAGHKQDFQEAESLRALHLAERICDVTAAQEVDRQHLESTTRQDRQSAANGSASLSTSSVMTRSRSIRYAEATKERIVREAAAWHKEHGVQEIADDKFMESYFYASKANAIASATLTKGRMKKLITQLASLRQDLPTGIYVRHAASRIDVMKVLIVGPADTPYELGLFEFDIFCGAEFPNRPPEVQFRTTGGGRITFNPNLYHNGKVCLSLLGTWSGQPWIPGESTLEQILISIQAMIFVENPWYNEPGRERRLDDTQSQAYNRQVQQWTVRHAMTYWLESRLGQPEKGQKPNRVPRTVPKPATTVPVTSGPLSGTSGSSKGPTLATFPKHVPYLSQYAGPGLGNPSATPSLFSGQTGLPPSGLTPSQMFNMAGNAGNQGMPQPTPAQPSFPPGFPPGLMYYLKEGGHVPAQSNAVPPPPGTTNPIGPQPLPTPASNYTTPGQMYSGAPGHPSLVQYTPAPPLANGLPALGPIPAPTPFYYTPIEGAVPHVPNKMPTTQGVKPASHVPNQTPTAQGKKPTLLLGTPATMFLQDLMDDHEALIISQGTPLPLPLVFGMSADNNPIGNTVVDSNDDNIWGDVIRKHFSWKAATMLDMAKKWSAYWQGVEGAGPSIIKDLQAALELHDFI